MRGRFLLWAMWATRGSIYVLCPKKRLNKTRQFSNRPFVRPETATCVSEEGGGGGRELAGEQCSAEVGKGEGDRLIPGHTTQTASK